MRPTFIALLALGVCLPLGCGKKKPDKQANQPESNPPNQPQAKPKPNLIFDPIDESHFKIEKAIRGQLKKTTGELTKADLEQITELDLSDSQLTDISPLVWLTGMTKLSLKNNKLTDGQLKHLAGLTKLQRLILGQNQFTDISPLANLTQLVALRIQSNQITNLRVLRGLTQLKRISLDNNPDLKKEEVDKLRSALPDCEIHGAPTK